MQASEISTNDAFLEIPGYKIKSVIIRSGRIWGILNNLTLFYADLNQRFQPFIKVFSDIDQCLFLHVSSDGEFCLAQRGKGLTHVSATDLLPVDTPMLPGSSLRTAVFFTPRGYAKPFLFMVTQDYQVCYVNFNGLESMKVNMVAISLHRDKVVNGIAMAEFRDGYFACIMVYQDSIVPFLLDPEFVEVKTNLRCSLPITISRHANIFIEKNLIGCITETNPTGKKQKLLIVYAIDYDKDHPNLDKILSNDTVYELPYQKTLGFCLFDEFVFYFRKDGIVNIFMKGMANEVDEFKISDAKTYSYDTDNGELYAVYSEKVTCIKFDSNLRFRGTDALRFWLYHRFLTREDYKSAASCLINISSLTLNEKINNAKNSAKLRFYVYRNIFQLLRKQKGITKAKVAIAIALYTLYTQIECSKTEPNLEKYCEFTKDLLNEGLINIETITYTLNELGWDAPLARMGFSTFIFNKLMERNQKDKAIQILPKIVETESQTPDDSNSDSQNSFCDFAYSALRVFTHNKEQVCNLISKQKELNNSKYIPILTSDYCREFVLELLSTGRLTNSWIAKLFAIAIAKSPNVEQVKQFFIKYSDSNTGEIPFIIRSLNHEQQYEMLVHGLTAIKKYVLAAIFAAKGDPISSFKIIPDDIDNETKKRCAFACLRIINKAQAGELAQQLIYRYSGSGSDTTFLFQFLLNDTPIATLSSPLAEFSHQKNVSFKKQQKNIDDALSAINKASELIKCDEHRVVVLTSTELCEKCRKPFFGEKGLIFPCSHMLHVKCAELMIKSLQNHSNNRSNFFLDCPICGIVSAHLMDAPFHYETEDGKDIFSNDIHQLRQNYNINNSNINSLLKKQIKSSK